MKARITEWICEKYTKNINIVKYGLINCLMILLSIGLIISQIIAAVEIMFRQYNTMYYIPFVIVAYIIHHLVVQTSPVAIVFAEYLPPILGKYIKMFGFSFVFSFFDVIWYWVNYIQMIYQFEKKLNAFNFEDKHFVIDFIMKNISN